MRATGGYVTGWVKTSRQDDAVLLLCGGNWRLPELAALDRALLDGLDRLGERSPARVGVVLEQLEQLLLYNQSILEDL